MAEVSIMAMPIAPGTPPLGPDGANLLLGIRGTWKGRPPLAPGPVKGLNQLREWMDARIAEVMHVVDSGGGANVQIQLKADFHAAYKALVPPDIQFALDAALAEAQAAGTTPPLLRVYVHPHLEWIPWELLHDGTDHLGVRFMIARLPVLDTGPEALPPGSARVVTTIASVIGETIPVGKKKLMDEWTGTFDGLVNGPVPARHPADSHSPWPVIDDVLDAATADIFHITCHGLFTKEGTGYWSLNEKVGTPPEHHVDANTVGVMELSKEGGLVFANACASSTPGVAAPAAPVGPAGVEPVPRLAEPSGGLASAFFGKGTLAFIGTLAPITRTVAIPFAKTFFTHLLSGKGMPVAEALWTSKAEYRAAKVKDPSWLFYCLYGPPDTRFAVGAQ